MSRLVEAFCLTPRGVPPAPPGDPETRRSEATGRRGPVASKHVTEEAAAPARPLFPRDPRGQDQPDRSHAGSASGLSCRQAISTQSCSPPGGDPSSPFSPGTCCGPARGHTCSESREGGPGVGGGGACWSPSPQGLASPVPLPGLPSHTLAGLSGPLSFKPGWVSWAGLVPVTAGHLVWRPWLLDTEHVEGAPEPCAP